MGLIGWLFDFIRDLAIMAAAVGIAKWAWDRHLDQPERRQQRDRRRRDAEQLRAEAAAVAARLEALLKESVAAREAQAAGERERAALIARKVLVHRVLQSTGDPYLSLPEIEAACSADHAATADQPPLAGDALRRVLMELVADGLVTQLDHDRYFIASEFETDDAPPGTVK